VKVSPSLAAGDSEGGNATGEEASPSHAARDSLKDVKDETLEEEKIDAASPASASDNAAASRAAAAAASPAVAWSLEDARVKEVKIYTFGVRQARLFNKETGRASREDVLGYIEEHYDPELREHLHLIVNCEDMPHTLMRSEKAKHIGTHINALRRIVYEFDGFVELVCKNLVHVLCNTDRDKHCSIIFQCAWGKHRFGNGVADTPTAHAFVALFFCFIVYILSSRRLAPLSVKNDCALY
jgi:hypothetical protein